MLLTTAVATGGSVALYDLNGDNVLSLADVDAWRAEAGEVNLGPGRVYLVGDANLDSVVDGSDFGRWNAAKFTNNTNWCDGNFNADLVVDGSDFGLWNSQQVHQCRRRGTRERGNSPDATVRGCVDGRCADGHLADGRGKRKRFGPG